MSIGPISSSTRSTSVDEGRLVGDVELHTEAADLVADRPRRVAVAVGDDNGACTVGHPAAGDGRADPAAAAGDDGTRSLISIESPTYGGPLRPAG